MTVLRQNPAYRRARTKKPLILSQMCGRFAITGKLDFYAEYFTVDAVATEPLTESWNVAPTDPIYVVAEHKGERQLGTMRWGLVPHWAKDGRTIHINARSETVASNRTFADSFATRRLLIPADGFYEWGPAEQGKTPHWVYRSDGFPMAFAGIWSSRLDPDTNTWIRTCAILTAPAQGVIADIHHRMPMTVSGEHWDRWLDRDLVDPEAALDLLQQSEPDDVMEHAVSREVNSVRNNHPDLRLPAPPETLF